MQGQRGSRGPRGTSRHSQPTLQVAWLSISCHVGSSRFLSAMTPCSATNTISRAALCMLTARSYRRAAFCVSCWAWGERAIRMGSPKGPQLTTDTYPAEDKRRACCNVSITSQTVLRMDAKKATFYKDIL